MPGFLLIDDGMRVQARRCTVARERVLDMRRVCSGSNLCGKPTPSICGVLFRVDHLTLIGDH
jgi:hypothetical protein